MVRAPKDSIRGFRDIRPCRRCREPIFFATTAKNQRPIPLDATPQKLVRVELGDTIPGGTQRELIAHVEDAYTPHHATCRHVDDFRRPKRSSPDAKS